MPAFFGAKKSQPARVVNTPGVAPLGGAAYDLDVSQYLTLVLLGQVGGGATAVGDCNIYVQMWDAVNGAVVPASLASTRNTTNMNGPIAVRFMEYNVIAMQRVRLNIQNSNATLTLNLLLDAFLQ